MYHPCILQAKKRYVGYSYESLEQKEPIFDDKGIETVRRDGCPAVGKVGRGVEGGKGGREGGVERRREGGVERRKEGGREGWKGGREGWRGGGREEELERKGRVEEREGSGKRREM